MLDAPVTPDMKVWTMFQHHPQTMDVFLRHGCPDMRKGIFPFMARIMKVRWAARMHGIPLDALMRDLNAAVAGPMGNP